MGFLLFDRRFPPSLIPALQNIGILHHKKAKLTKHLQHSVIYFLMFVLFFFAAMLMYRTCRCCRRIWSKLLHTTFHLLAAPCIAIGFVAVYDYHNDRTDGQGNPHPIPHFYSIHSWMGLTTMGLFALQVLRVDIHITYIPIHAKSITIDLLLSTVLSK